MWRFFAALGADAIPAGTCTRTGTAHVALSAAAASHISFSSLALTYRTRTLLAFISFGHGLPPLVVHS